MLLDIVLSVLVAFLVPFSVVVLVAYWKWSGRMLVHITGMAISYLLFTATSLFVQLGVLAPRGVASIVRVVAALIGMYALSLVWIRGRKKEYEQLTDLRSSQEQLLQEIKTNRERMEQLLRAVAESGMGSGFHPPPDK